MKLEEIKKRTVDQKDLVRQQIEVSALIVMLSTGLSYETCKREAEIAWKQVKAAELCKN
jgi:hypothetical protein